jgi:hypothetical protein
MGLYRDLIKIAFDYASSNSLSDIQINRLKRINERDLGKLNSMGLGPLYAYITEDLSIDCGSEIKDSLMSLSLTAQYLASCRKNALKEIEQQFKDMYLLKGMSVIDVYPEKWIRLMGDVDILVPKSEIPTFSETLAQFGYEQRSEYSTEFYRNFHHMMPFFHPDTAVWIEVHTSIFPCEIKPESECFDQDYFFSHSERIDGEGGSFLRPTVELNLVYIMTHWALEFRVRDSAMQLLDVLYLVNRYKNDIDWSNLLSLINDRTTAACVYICMTYLRNHGVFLADKNVYKSLREKRKSIGVVGTSILLNIIETFFEGKKWPLAWLGVNNLSIIWAALISDRPALVNYYNAIKNIIFPPEHEKRYSPLFQLSRLISIFNKE